MSMLKRAPSRSPWGASQQRFHRTFAALIVVGSMMAALAASGPAAADYGQGAVYQVEISANLAGPDGGGIWLWLGLNANGTGDYHGADCGHGFGAVPDAGDVTWRVSGGTLTISGVILAGLGGLPVTITVPARFGHYPYSGNPFAAIFGLPFPGGFAQVQIAP